MLRALLRLKPRDVPVRVALRNTFAVVAPLALGVAAGHPSAGLAVSIGALNTMFGDQPGAYALRMQRMLIAAVAAGLSAALGIVLGGHTLLLTLAVAAFGFGGGLLVALGPIATRIGLTSMILLMVSAQMQVQAANAPGVAALIFAGGLLQMLMAVAAWPLQRYRPERFALATILQQLAITARTRPDPSQPSPTLQAAQDALVLLHGQHHARGMAVQTFRVMAELCERVRVEVLSLADAHERIEDAHARERIETLLKQAASVLDHLSTAMRDAVPPQAQRELAALEPLIEDLNASRTRVDARRDQRLLRIASGRAAALAGQLRALARNSDWASSQGEIRGQHAEARLPQALRPGNPRAILRANLSLSSSAFRHALRCAVSLVLALLVERVLAMPHGVWIPMTTAIVLKPDFGGTLSFGALRVAGTLAGLVIATALIHFAMDGVLLRLLLLALLCAAFRLTTQMNYGLGVAMLTGMLVLLLSFEGFVPGDAIGPRVLATLIGSALAMLAYALWPTWEGNRVHTALADLLEADRRHIAALLAGQVERLDDTRSAARVARTNVQASIDRLRAEPRRGDNRARAQLAESLLANATRLMRAPLSLEAQLREGGALPEGEAVPAFAAAAERSLAALVEVLRETRKPSEVPPLRPHERELSAQLSLDEALAFAVADACDRIADSTDTLAHLLRRGVAKAAPIPAGAAADG